MSFILDALRKSESERQQDARPNVAAIPDAVPQRRVPAWALGTMTLLAVGVVALGAAWWRSVQNPATTEAAAVAETADAPRSLPLPIPRPDPRPRTTSARPAASVPEFGRSTLREAASVGVEHVPSSPLAASGPAPATAAGGSRTEPRIVAADPSPQSDPLLQRYSSGRADLPSLRLELHAYDEAPASRFVFINGSKYVEGDTLAEGPRLIAITSDGAVLLAAGQEWLLGQE